MIGWIVFVHLLTHDSLFSMNVDKTNALLFVADKLNIGSNNKRSAFFEDHL
jgi:hypothetical protein